LVRDLDSRVRDWRYLGGTNSSSLPPSLEKRRRSWRKGDGVMR